MEKPNRIFLLSPAYAGGRRAQMILREEAQFDLARRLRSQQGTTLTEIFTFLSGLYFRGKIAYAETFAQPLEQRPGVLIITPTRGLLDANTRFRLDDLREFAEVDIDDNDPRYRAPLERDAHKMASQMTDRCEVVLLGSVATGKYVNILLEHLGEHLRFPADFVGRGDMSRGGLLLRSAADKVELPYIPVAGAVRTGRRPPKLTPRRYPKDDQLGVIESLAS